MQGTLHAFDVPAITLRFIPARGAGRLIPARAGNTLRPQRQLPLPSAHPRSRGEHASAEPNTLSHCGPSPLARGTHASCLCDWCGHRLIPACSGNTHPASGSPSLSPAHPRSRGEHSAPGLISQVRRGSSPHAQGTLFVEAGVFGSVRRISAHAGNTGGVWQRT